MPEFIKQDYDTKKIFIILKNCPLCGSADFSFLQERQYPEGKLTISRCNSCSISFSSTRFSDEYLLYKYYSHNFQEEILGAKDYGEISRRFFQDICRKVSKRKKSGKWLDIGCGRGYLLNIAGQYGYDCYGLDLKDDLINSDIKFFNGDFIDCDFGQNRFDIITMINVLDHIGDPKTCLNKVYSLLNPGGILFIHLQNEHYFFLNSIFPSLTGYFPSDHLVNYSEKNIATIFKRFNFDQVEFFAPRYKLRKNKGEMLLVYLLEMVSNVLKIFCPCMQVIAYKGKD